VPVTWAPEPTHPLAPVLTVTSYSLQLLLVFCMWQLWKTSFIRTSLGAAPKRYIPFQIRLDKDLGGSSRGAPSVTIWWRRPAPRGLCLRLDGRTCYGAACSASAARGTWFGAGAGSAGVSCSSRASPDKTGSLGWLATASKLAFHTRTGGGLSEARTRIDPADYEDILFNV
jgi:hypothetical protein